MTSKHVKSIYSGSLESELFKFYFMTDIKDNTKTMNINIMDGSNLRNITSITYIIQFVCNDKIYEEISIVCTYKKNSKTYRLNLYKHISSNLYTTKQQKEIISGVRIGFPKSDYILSTDTTLTFTKTFSSDYIIGFIDSEGRNMNIGILEFINSNKKISINMEPIVKCIIKTESMIDMNILKKMFFIMKSPVLNNIPLELSKQYRVSINHDTINNKINVIDIGIVDIKFDEDKAIVYSLISKPKTKMHVYKSGKDVITYGFSNYQSVY